MGMVKAERVVVVAQGLIDDTSLVLMFCSCMFCFYMYTERTTIT
jgi:hypothetical protein